MKAYKFTIHASPSERGAMEGFVTTYPMSTVHREEFEGTLENVAQRVKQLREELITSRQFESGKGFSIDAMLWRGQRKPSGYDSRRRERCTNYIAA
jgi:hypothetical protein